jgi:hypothetical protein
MNDTFEFANVRVTDKCNKTPKQIIDLIMNAKIKRVKVNKPEYDTLHKGKVFEYAINYKPKNNDFEAIFVYLRWYMREPNNRHNWRRSNLGLIELKLFTYRGCEFKFEDNGGTELSWKNADGWEFSLASWHDESVWIKDPSGEYEIYEKPSWQTSDAIAS